MCHLSYVIVTIFSLVPVWPHFVWPLSYCLLADVCNHTWIPECGIAGYKVYRLFIDECDMFEYNCDKEREYELANYSDCFSGPSICPDPRHKKKFHRIGDLRFELDGQKVVYDPKRAQYGERRTPFDPSFLPKHMLKGKRRYTPEARRRMNMRLHTRVTKSMVKKSTKAQLQTYIIKKVTVIKNGRKMIKVVKGVRKVTKTMDSDFIQ